MAPRWHDQRTTGDLLLQVLLSSGALVEFIREVNRAVGPAASGGGHVELGPQAIWKRLLSLGSVVAVIQSPAFAGPREYLIGTFPVPAEPAAL